MSIGKNDAQDNSESGQADSNKSSARLRHFVLFAYETWGHARPLSNLAARLVRSGDTIVTFFTTPSFYDRIKAELLRNFDTDESHLASSIRLVALKHSGAHTLDNSVVDGAFVEAFKKLVKSEPLQCAHTKVEHEGAPRPKAVLIDFFGLPLLQAVRHFSVGGEPVKVFVWFAGAASIIFRIAAPERIGGVGNLPAKSAEEAERKHENIAQAAGDIALGDDGDIVHIPGFPPMYDYEIEPQTVPARALTGAMLLAANEVFNACDGLVLASPECYEQETTAALREWMAETGRPLYTVGPMIAEGEHADVVEKRQSDSTAEIDEFLASTLKQHGERSLLYISFGTVFWSMEPEKIWTFVDTVLELRIPFIMSHASPWATVPPVVVEKVKQSGVGIIVPYSPQQHVLHHPATGWFLTHGGHNSVIESICAGVPMIFWPFSFDQPLNAIHMTSSDLAYEVFNGRTGPGLRPIHRLSMAPKGTLDALKNEAREILRNAFGDDGQRKRERLYALQSEVLEARSSQGFSTRQVQALLQSL